MPIDPARLTPFPWRPSSRPQPALSRVGSPACWLLLCVLACACNRHEEGLLPAGGTAESEASLVRFVRRLHLDLSGAPPSPVAQQAALTRLQREGNTAAVRGALAEELLAAPAFAKNFVNELESRALAGQGRDGSYQLICAFYRLNEAECARCPAATEDYCGDCTCRVLAQLRAERDQLAAAPDDLAGGATTVEIERRYANAQAFRLLFGAPETVAGALFRQFLGRAPDPDETRNAAALVVGPLISERAPSGLLFHRHGTGYPDLVDILFTSEAYREALVDRAFVRHLGRAPTPRERSYFSARIDAKSPDARPLVQAIVSSQEYFVQ